MRTFVAATVAATMIATTALAATAVDKPLAPGKPAGVKKAQDPDDNTVLYVVGLGVVGGGLALVMSGNSNDSVVQGTSTTS